MLTYALKLADATNGDWSSLAMTAGTYTSTEIPVGHSQGFASLLVATTGGSLNISFQVSLDGSTFYTPYNTSGTSLGSINTAVTSTAWIVFSPQLANYIRFVFVLTGNSTVSATYIQQEKA